MTRWASAVDANQSEIVAMLRAAGCSVQPLHRVGQGCPDLLVGHQGRNLLFEVKDGQKPASARKLTKAEAEWHETWSGHVVTVSSVRDALEAIGIGVTATRIEP